MKLALFDPNIRKFTRDIENWFRETGYETKYEPYYNPELVRWADITWFDTADNNAIQANKTPKEKDRIKNMDLTNKIIICRPIDIEVWSGVSDNIDWTGFTDIIFPCKHIKRIMIDKIPKNIRFHDIPYSVNMDRFTFYDKVPNKNIAWIAHRWTAKGLEYALQIALKLKTIDPEYKIYALGTENFGSWEKAYFDYFRDINNIDNMLYEDRVDDVNTWLDDKSYTLCTSKKETFSYAIAEGMAKGLKPIIHNFLGAYDIWDKNYVWNTIDEAVEMITNKNYNSCEYIQYIRYNYSLDKIMKRIENEVIIDNPNLKEKQILS